jgi:hypothetical protein
VLTKGRSKLKINVGIPFKKIEMALISGVSGSVAILKIHNPFELGAVDYSRLAIFILLIGFWVLN